MLDILNKSRRTPEARGETPPPSAVPVRLPGQKTWADYLFLLLVGGLYLFALNRAIITSTFIWVSPVVLYAIGMLSILIFLIILHNHVTRIATLAILVLIAAYVLFTLEDFAEQYSHFYELFLMITGRLAYRHELGMTIVWIISLLLGFTVVVFMFHSFNFVMLAIGGVAVFMFTWLPGFTRDEFSFLLFLFAFCLLLIRKTNKSTAMVFMAAPLCALLVVLTQAVMPAESGLYVRRQLRQAVDGPMTAIGDFIFELFNPMYFSFQSTGFAGPGGRLGGPITPNNRSVMTVQAPGRTYLAGASSNTFTGYSWISTLNHGDVNTHGLPPGHFETLETAAALMRGATHVSERDRITIASLRLSLDEHRRLQTRNFPVMGVAGSGFLPYYLHTYLPVDITTIAMGSNRTGTVFRPGRMTQLWFYQGGPDYLPVVTLSATGDIRAPGFMSRGTTYHMEFLNVNTQFSFVEYILQQANRGVYAARGRGFSYEPLSHRLPEPTAGSAQTALLTLGERPSDFVLMPSSFHGGRAATGELIILPDGYFGVAEMARLFDLHSRAPSQRPISYIYSEETLLGWLDSFSANVLAVYAQEVRQHFTDVPEIVPRRVFDLTYDIVYGLESDFERVMAIREYLLGFPYTLSPPPVPRGVCFVDHFLFEAQMGYCTYFASAMAIMARIAGVPSRYVEGFVLPPTLDPGAPVNVTNRMAHAWVEVYLEGFGWHIIEATPTYAFLMDPLAPVAGLGIDPYDLGWIEGLMYDWDIDLLEEMADMLAHMRGDANQPAEESPAGGNITIQQVRLAVAAFAALIIIAVLLFFSVRRWQIKYRLWRVKELPPNEQIQAYFKGILDIVTHYTNPVAAGETPKAYGGRMGKRFAFQSDTVFFRDLINLYYKSKYSSHEATEAEIKLMEQAYFDMLNLLRSARRKYRFIYLRYVKRVGAI